jgi:hypothetical protein
VLGRVSTHQIPSDISPGTRVNPMGTDWHGMGLKTCLLSSHEFPDPTVLLSRIGQVAGSGRVLKILENKPPAPNRGGGGLSHDSLSETWSKRGANCTREAAAAAAA